MESLFKNVVDEARRETIRVRNNGYDPGRPRFDIDWLLRIAGAVHGEVEKIQTRLASVESMLAKLTEPKSQPPTK